MRKLSIPLAIVAMAGVLGAAAARAEPSDRLLADIVPAAEAQRTVEIAPDTKWVNVTHGDVVKFEAQGQEFAVAFDGADDRSFDLARVAPAGALDHAVTVYVATEHED